MIILCFFIGLCSDFGQINSRIVLAGDPRQLEAVTLSKHAVKLGFKKSYMEFLMDQTRYSRDPNTGKYDPHYIVQLTKNYRSHSAILYIPNKQFYENKLESKALPGNSISS